jgi:hypothetical protein
MNDERAGIGAVLCILAATSGVAGCGGGKLVASPTTVVAVPGLARLGDYETVRFAYELMPACKLESARAEATAPPDGGWRPLDPNAIGPTRYEVVGRYLVKSSGDVTTAVALRLRSPSGKEFWVRNEPTPEPAALAVRWRCVVDDKWIATQAPKLTAKVVRLSARSLGCNAITPILGGQDDLTFLPYTVAGLRLVAGEPPTRVEAVDGRQGPIAVGVRLEADGGQKRLTVATGDFDRCFEPADEAPPPPDEAQALVDWLAASTPDALSPPRASLEAVEAVTGIRASLCLKDDLLGRTHHECRAPVRRIAARGGKGPFGPSVLELSRERVADAFHLVDGKLVSPVDAVRVLAAVRLPNLPAEGAFARAFRRALEESAKDPAKKLQRGLRGFRLLLEGDLGKGVAPTHSVSIALQYSIPDVQVATEKRTHKYVAGKKKLHNEAFDKAKRDLDLAKNELESAKHEVKMIEQAASHAASASEQGCKQAAGGGLFGALLGAACGGAVSGTGGAAARSHLTSAQQKLASAEAKLKSTPEELEVDDEQTFEYEAKIYHRRGEATASVTITSGASAQGQPLLTTSVGVPFDAADVEIPDDPQHKLQGKKALPPSADDAQATLARALVPVVDEVIVKWGAQRQVGGDIAEMVPGTRPWMVAVARRAASERNVKLLSDLLESRTELLARGSMDYAVKMPADADRRCFVLAAIPLDAGANADVELQYAQRAGASRSRVLARDARPEADAAVEVCNLPAGSYAARVKLVGKAAQSKGVLVALFDSTPGGPTADDSRSASRGIPTRARRGEEMALDGEGVVRFRGTNDQVVVGRVGDRDGDGIDDDKDRCPYDPETRNGYLDEDGCPDEKPAGYAAPKGKAPEDAPSPARATETPDKPKRKR